MLIELAPLLSAFLMWAAFPPLGWGALVLVAPTPLLAALRKVEGRKGAALIGLVYGVAFNGLLLWWIKGAGIVAVVALVLALAAFSVLYALLVHSARNWSLGTWWIIAVGGWALIEFARARIPFGGFPWGSLGYPVGEYEWPRAATQFIGTTGWSVVIIGVAAGLTLFVTDRRRPTVWLWPSVAVVLLLTLLGGLFPPSADGPPVRVALVQGGSPCPGESCADENALIFQSHLELTRTLSPDQVDLVVWPESSVGSNLELVTHPVTASQVAGEARRLNAYFLVGSHRNLDDETFINANVVIEPSGEIIGEYQKHHPVPFGEYVPLRPLFDWFPPLDQVPRDMVRGKENTTFDLPDGRLGSVISFEGAFARSVRPVIRQGAKLLVIATNEATFGDSPATDQFIAITRMRAAEHGIDIVHAAITGRSAFITADGSVKGQTNLFTEEAVTTTLNYRSATLTLYSRWGDWVQYLALIALVATYAIGRRRQKPVVTSDDETAAPGSSLESLPMP